MLLKTSKLISILAALVISYYTAKYFGKVYDNWFGLGGAWIGSEGSWQFIRGISLSLIFFLTLFGYSFVFRSLKSTMWLISPLILWDVSFDLRHIYIPIILILLALGIAFLVRKIFSRKIIPQT